jgi:tRNA A-37 threonylcarbamoyl transferase component Bud32
MLLHEATDTRYDIVKILGQGASATVYLARHVALGELRVLKILHHDMMMDAKRRAKFMLEAQVSAHLKHPAIVQVFDVTQTSSKLQIEMEHIEGMSLRQYQERRKLFPLSITLAIIQAILEGMEHAHRARLTLGDTEFDGVIHRDLKPENIMIRKNGQPVICDFGVAKVGADLMTMTQHISGSVAYMAPERLRGELSTRSIDVFALGVMFFELHKGFRPFNGNNKTQVLENILKWNIVDMDLEWRGSDAAVLQVVKKAIARDPAQRYQDASQMLAALRPIYKLYHGDAQPANVIQDYLTRGQFTTAEFRALVPEASTWKSRIPLFIGTLAAGAVAFTLYAAWPKAPARPAVTPKSPAAALEQPGREPTLDEAEKKIRELPAAEQQRGYFNLAKTYLTEKRDAGSALLLVNKALDFSFHPTIALLKTEILLDQEMLNLAESELVRVEPWLAKMTRENQAQYQWLCAQMELRREADAPGPAASGIARAKAKAALKRYLALQPKGATENLKKARQLILTL